ncbi:hypothetical protein [Streptococcus pneumoniae]|uniref:hypothetical protein n=1 Tax=Streptococcus pneumoniae TaxID=1313 RepID=UPI0011562197|nr:hypothetical protein [Streptococcus pneumoniae]
MRTKASIRKLVTDAQNTVLRLWIELTSDRTDEVSSNHLEVMDRTDEVSSKHADEVSNHTYGRVGADVV